MEMQRGEHRFCHGMICSRDHRPDHRSPFPKFKILSKQGVGCGNRCLGKWGINLQILLKDYVSLPSTAGLKSCFRTLAKRFSHHPIPHRGTGGKEGRTKGSTSLLGFSPFPSPPEAGGWQQQKVSEGKISEGEA